MHKARYWALYKRKKTVVQEVVAEGPFNHVVREGLKSPALFARGIGTYTEGWTIRSKQFSLNVLE